MGVLQYFCICFCIFFLVNVASLKLSILISKILFEFKGTNISVVSFLSYYFSLLCCLFGVHFSSYNVSCQASSSFSGLCSPSIHRVFIANSVTELPQKCLCCTWIPRTRSLPLLPPLLKIEKSCMKAN